MTTILKALVGSRAHGLHHDKSDYDWRGVFVTPTREILSMNYKPHPIQWLEGREDFTSYEIGHFLMLACKANPSVLELLRSNTYDFDDISIRGNRMWGSELRGLMPYMYHPQDAFNAALGYSLNQRKKLLDDKDGRKWKYATAYVRTLYNLIDLLKTGDFSLCVKDQYRLKILRDIRDGKNTPGEILDLANSLEIKARLALETAENKQDLKKINDFLLEIRKEFY